jgi:uncharacterized protein
LPWRLNKEHSTKERQTTGKQIRVRSEKYRRHTSIVCSLPSLVVHLSTFIKRCSVTIAVAMTFTGCSILAPTQEHTRFIVLSPIAPGTSNSTVTANSSGPPLAIGLGPVRLPEYLDRPELVIRTSPNGFDLSEIYRWAEPLSDNFRHVLATDLIAQLGGGDLVQYPWFAGTRLDYVVQVQVEHFEAGVDHSTQLSAHWELKPPNGDQVLASNETQLSRPVDSLEGDTVAAALSTDLGALARQIAAAIVQAQQERVARGEK